MGSGQTPDLILDVLPKPNMKRNHAKDVSFQGCGDFVLSQHIGGDINLELDFLYYQSADNGLTRQ